MHYIAHRDEDGSREQSMVEHLWGTAELASEFAAAFGAQTQANYCGIAHDIGKYSRKFQRRIRGSKEQVDHSTAGALIAAAQRDPIAAICIAGHHGGLPDFGDRSDSAQMSTLCGRLKRRVGVDIEDFSAYLDKIAIPETQVPKDILMDPARGFFFAHMLYSCLVDADWLDTEAFYQHGYRACEYEPTQVLFEKFQAYIAKWWDAEGEINKKRCEILRAALARGAGQPGMYSLTAPTGSGKTAASVAFALSHLLQGDLRRIIYVIPYISILEQTKATFEAIFGKQNVVAHYANVDFGDDETDKRHLAAENWDAPIILTTSVQFFESLFASKPSRCRKLHNIARSVIIFDEAQMLPVNYLKPCVWATSQLVQHFGCTAVLCTATQPALDALLTHYLPGVDVREICPDARGMHDFFRRVRFEHVGKLQNSEIASMLTEREQVLCVVNSKKQARALFALIPPEGSFHLTTAMTPEHRRTVLEEIRGRLSLGEPCRVVATSLVEAGVDMDFPSVFRELAGLDSIIQAAGRCNRNGKRRLDESVVCIFESEEKPPRIFAQNIAATKQILRDFGDISSPEAIQAYFDFLYYTLKGEKALDNKGIMEQIEKGSMAFASVARAFKLIEDDQITVYVPLGKGESLVRDLRANGPDRKLMRALGQYAVGVYPEAYRDLYYAGAVEQIADDAAILLDLKLYDAKMGLAAQPTTGQGHFI